jgi:hypothetical protein
MLDDTTYAQSAEFTENFTPPLPSLSEVIDWINSNLDPEQVFSVDELGVWAEANGYVREED